MEKAWRKKRSHVALQKRYQFLIDNPDYCTIDEIQRVEAMLRNYEIDEWEKQDSGLKILLKSAEKDPWGILSV